MVKLLTKQLHIKIGYFFENKRISQIHTKIAFAIFYIKVFLTNKMEFFQFNNKLK